MRQREAAFVDSGVRRKDLQKLSAVDAASFTIVKRAKIRLAFAFDHHFAFAGLRLVA